MFIHRRFSSSYSSTIFALVTTIGPKGSPVAVVRVSGKEVKSVLKKLSPEKEFKPRVTTFSKLYDEKKEVVDSGLVTVFQKPSSYTGEDVCEISVHGSKAVVSSLLSTLGNMKGLRPAERGEFTKRAFLNKKMSLTEAEAVNDLIESRNESQRKRALQAVSGHVQSLYSKWRTQLIESTAIIEANIDFGEDELIDSETITEARRQLTLLKNEIKNHLNQVSKISALIEHGIQIVVLGRPNVGKSSLVNKLASKDVSIVSPFSGTTRDVVETSLDICGQSITICDTAGLREVSESSSDEIVEKEGMKRARIKAKSCDIIIFVSDGESDDETPTSSDSTELKEVLNGNPEAILIRVRNKVDLESGRSFEREKVDPENGRSFEREKVSLENGRSFERNDVVETSCITDEGISELIDRIGEAVESITNHGDSSLTFLNQRHESILVQVNFSLNEALSATTKDLAISGHHLKRSAEKMSQLTGHISNEDILDVIFEKFCIGK